MVHKEHIVYFVIFVIFCGLVPTHANNPVNTQGIQGSQGTQHNSGPLTREAFTQTPQKSVQLLHPSGFNMQQSYTMRYSAVSTGESSSAGVYLNTLSYQFSAPLTLFLDLGAFNLFHYAAGNSGSSYNSVGLSSDPYQTPDQQNVPQLLIPRIGLEYRPTDNVMLSFQFINVSDMYKAYGNTYGNPYLSPFSRFNAGSRLTRSGSMW